MGRISAKIQEQYSHLILIYNVYKYDSHSQG